MPIPPDNRAAGDAGHVTDHNQISDELTALVAADAAETSRATAAEALKATLASPSFTGTPTAPTPGGGDSSTKLATTAFVAGAAAVKAGLLTPTAVKTSAYTAAAGDFVPVDTTSGNVTVTLPNAPADLTVVAVKHVIQGGVNKVTYACAGSDVINKTGGATSGTLALLAQCAVLQYKASGGIWYVTADDLPLPQLDLRNGSYYLDSYAGTDDQKMTAAIAAVVAAGGGTIVLGPRAHTFASQWTTSYVSSSSTTGIRITGAGVAFNGAWGAPSAATTCTFTYSGGGAACMDFQHNGSIELSGIQFKSANVGVPLFQTTNANPNIHDCVFSGGGTGTACVTDAIILGGTGSAIGAGDTAPYQGYQGTIYRNYFDGIRRIAVFQVFANSIEIYANTVSTSCGNKGYLAGCIEFANTAGADTGNHIWGNCVEMVNYPCFIRCTSNAALNTFGPNGLFDASATIAYYVFLASSCQFNKVIDGMRTDSVPLILDLSGNVLNEATSFHQSQYSLYTTPVAYFSNSYPPIYTGVVGGPISMDAKGNGAQLAAINDVPSANDSGVQIYAYSCTQVTDGAIYSGSNVVTSVTAAFTTTDVYRPIGYTGVATTSTIIIRSVTHTTAFPWVASTAYALGDVARPTAGNSHLYQCTTAGTSSSTQPTWPTSGGTVTDGTAVWTDLGTTATAAILSGPSTATATGVTVSFGRMQGVQTFTSFKRHHVITADGAAPSAAADAGAGTGPSGISATGSDHSFTVNITSGTAPASGQMFHANLANNAGTMHVIMNAGNSAAATLMAGGFWVVVAANVVQVNFSTAPVASTAYVFNFVGMA